jgi:hypothetical protein
LNTSNYQKDSRKEDELGCYLQNFYCRHLSKGALSQK